MTHLIFKVYIAHLGVEAPGKVMLEALAAVLAMF